MPDNRLPSARIGRTGRNRTARNPFTTNSGYFAPRFCIIACVSVQTPAGSYGFVFLLRPTDQEWTRRFSESVKFSPVLPRVQQLNALVCLHRRNWGSTPMPARLIHRHHRLDDAGLRLGDADVDEPALEGAVAQRPPMDLLLPVASTTTSASWLFVSSARRFSSSPSPLGSLDFPDALVHTDTSAA